ncbi:MAG: sigma-54 dependent transcriptional regulator [Zoogloeaceae bacterium]|nr:sigma-54 dependent transcriptional regulator [Zoogloeaceae bacterium]
MTTAGQSEIPAQALLHQRGMAWRSAGMRELESLLLRIAPSRTTVLIEGESGAGKEVAATRLHLLSGRRGPFVAINCGSMSPELLDSELFGHARGAFTGASQGRDGLVLHADGGTLFLDEIGELPLFLQAKLLRVLETSSVRPVGTDVEVAVDLRVIAATNRPMARLVEDGDFREDLYYRLNVLAVRVPPLRERVEDLPELIEHFARHFAETLGVAPAALGRGGLRKLQSHSWPGNVRELRNLVERATLLGRNVDACLHVLPLDASALQALGDSGYAPDLPLVEVRRRHMERVLLLCKGNKSEAARRMGVSRKTLERWLREG